MGRRQTESGVGAAPSDCVHPGTANATAQAPTPITDYLQLSHHLATTVGQGMMHFTQAVAPQAQAGTGLLGHGGGPRSGQGF
jgi:hypothetical protein